MQVERPSTLRRRRLMAINKVHSKETGKRHGKSRKVEAQMVTGIFR